jgi:hypothetical protein
MIISCVSCFVKKENSFSAYEVSGLPGKTIAYEDLIRQNISNESFFIEKAEIDFLGDGGIGKLIGSIKFEKPDKYLVSIKSRTGVEILRVFISRDTILANDRINRKLYFESTKYLYSKLGLKGSYIPVIFGDFISDKKGIREMASCIHGFATEYVSTGDMELRYKIQCNSNKVIEAVSNADSNNIEIKFHFDNFKKSGSYLTPFNIEIRNSDNKININFRIRKIVYRWTGSIEFIPGNRYELRRLL